MATWPTGLPQYPTLAGDSREEPKQVKASRMMSGPVRLRRIHQNPQRPWKCSVVMTQTQLGTFETFFRTTTKGGSESFVWFFPDSASTDRNFIFNPDNPPTTSPMGGGNWMVELDLIYTGDV